MYSTTYTNYHHQIRKAPVKVMVVSSEEGISPMVKRLLVVVLALNFVLASSIYARLYMFPQAKYSMTELSSQVPVGQITESFVKELGTKNFSPAAVAKITHNPLTVQGRLISFGIDNIQVFEYADEKIAKTEGYALASKYEEKNSDAMLPENKVHVYVRNSLVIFYLGSNESIMNLISKNSYQATSGISLGNSIYESSAVSKIGAYYK